MKHSIYVASSWRNDFQQEVVKALRKAGHSVYDFKNPRPGENGFHWSEISPDWQSWGSASFRNALTHPIAVSGFASDYQAMMEADTCVLVLPCGRSAHLEAGWFAGRPGKTLIILLASENEPELMYRMADKLCCSIWEVISTLQC